MVTAIKENIEILKKAQELDRDIYRFTLQGREIPHQRVKIKQELEVEKNHLSELEAGLKKLQMKHKEKEGELAQKEASVKKLDGQLGQVKTNKEYAALQQEIASVKADNSLLEEEIIHILDELEAAEEEGRKEKERLKQIEKGFQILENELNQKEKTFADSIENLKKSRDEIVKQVPPEVQALYDLIVQKKQGLAVVKVNGETCGACQLQLRPQLLNEIRLAQSLIVCENCSRILYIED